MPTFNFNPNDMRPAALAPGSYEMAIEAMEDTVSKTNKPMIKITYNCVHQGFEGQKAWQYVVLPTGQFQIARLLLATGMFTEDDLIGKDVQFDYEEMVGRRVGVVLTPSTYNGNPTTNVSRLIPVDEVEGPSGETMAAAPRTSSNSGGGLL